VGGGSGYRDYGGFLGRSREGHMFSLGVVSCVFPCVGCISVVFLRLVTSILRFVSCRRAIMCIVM